MYIAMMESESKSWVALGKTENEAKAALMEVWNNAQAMLEIKRDHFWDDAIGYVPNNMVETPEMLDEWYGVQTIALDAGEGTYW